MFSLLNKFRFTADPAGTPLVLTPLNSGLKRRWELQDDGVSYRLQMETELVFVGSDYTYFKTIVDDGTPCEVEILIEQFCSGAWETWFQGRILPKDGKWDFDKCEAQLKVLPDDVYECAKRNFDKQTNWLLYDAPVTLKSLYGTIETIVCSYDGLVVIPNVQLLFLRDCFSGDGPHDVQFDPDPDPATGWTPVNQNQVFTGSTPGVSEVSIDTTWKREIVNQPTPPPGYGWISLGGDDWARPVSVVSSVQEQLELSYTYDAVVADFDVSNGRLLSELIQEAVNAYGCDIDEVVSNYLNINPDATAPTNDAYDYAQDDEGVLVSPLIFQKSDIVNADATNDAAYFPLSVTEMLTALRDSLNVFWAIVDDAGTIKLRIEHWSYFEGAAGMNLTTMADGKYIRGLNRYETDGQIPAFERFAFQESYSAGFLPARIDYGCATDSGRDYQLGQMNADFAGLYENASAGLNGFVFVCAYLISGTNYLLDSIDGVPNGAMKWKHLINNVWPFGRWSDVATSTAGGAFAVQTLKPRKEQGPILVPFCCGDFEPSETVETAIGQGRVKGAEEDTEAGILTLNLIHQ